MTINPNPPTNDPRRRNRVTYRHGRVKRREAQGAQGAQGEQAAVFLGLADRGCRGLSRSSKVR